jgi:ribosomal protein S18 acetylase RimI-like enzyme
MDETAESTRLSIRTAAPGDEAALSLVGSATFLETYAHMIPRADILSHCAHQHSPATYAAWLADTANTIWIAETESTGAPIGYLVLTRATLPNDAPQPDDLEVQRIYVLTRFLGTGIGSALMNLAVSKGLSRGASRLVLGVHNDNTRALEFYKRHAFVAIDGRKFCVGGSVFCDTVLARKLR